MADATDISTLRRILHGNRRIAVVGISAEWHRPSFFVGKYLLEHGYTMIPVNPKYGEVLGQVCYPNLAAARAASTIDMVDCFRKADDIGPLADQAIAIGAKTLWMQLGVVNRVAAAKASAAGLDVVMDRCVKIEHGRLFGGLAWAGVNTRVISARRPQQLPY
ncbi:MAG TPA: CoA-binding protein [Burkholderiaceae bacterium]|jgi:predicted CoA-binding protein|nr:CoA-binding protein [Burkholderiaceae bacterium]